MDYKEGIGYFLKSDLVDRLENFFTIDPVTYAESHIKEKLKESTGILIPGGLGDVDPKLYGQTKLFDNVDIRRNRCDFEFRLIEQALKQELPIFGICWGMQILNVFFGGTLIQDIPSQINSPIKHEGDGNPMHWVKCAKEKKLNEIVKTDRFVVNTTHHQAVDKLGRNLIIEAQSDDGVLEALSYSGNSWVLAVQWHPERLKDDLTIPAFQEVCLRLS